MSDPLTVFVSASEPDEFVPRLQSLGINAVRAELGTDFVFFAHMQKIGIERKSISNLLGSLKNRQLVEQAHRGVREFDRYILLIEGKFDYRADGKLIYHNPSDPRSGSDGWVESGWQWSAFDGMMMDLQLGLNVPVTRCPMFGVPEAVARIVLNLCAESHKFLRERQRPTLPASASLGGELYSDALWSLCALPGVGPEVAEAVIATAGTLQAAMSLLANVNSSQNIRVNGKKLGVKKAEKIAAAVLADYRARPLE